MSRSQRILPHDCADGRLRLSLEELRQLTGHGRRLLAAGGVAGARQHHQLGPGGGGGGAAGAGRADGGIVPAGQVGRGPGRGRGGISGGGGSLKKKKKSSDGTPLKSPKMNKKTVNR